MSELPALQSTLLAPIAGVRHAFFTRQGGVSTGIYDSLNVGLGSRDDPGRVLQNRRRAAAHFGHDLDALLTCYQIHSARCVVATQPGEGGWEADAVATATPGLVLGALAADCAPVLFADPEARIIAAAHAGWKGALTGVTDAAIDAMVELGAQRGRIIAAIGPCIGPASYEVGLEFLERFATDRPGSERFFTPGETPDKRQFDLPAFVLDRLSAAGIASCEWLGADTCADAENFFSNRRAFKTAEDDYGRLLSAITLD